MALTGLSSGLLPPAVVVYRSGAPFAGGIVCLPGPGTIKMPGPGRGQAGRDEQCPGWLLGPAGDRGGAGTASEACWLMTVTVTSRRLPGPAAPGFCL